MAKTPKKKKNTRAQNDSGFGAFIRGLGQNLRDSAADEIEYDGQKYGRDELIKLRDVNAAIEESSNKTGKKASKELKTLNKEREALLATCPDLRFASLDDLNKALVNPVKPTIATSVHDQPEQDETAASGPDQSAPPPVQMDATQNKSSITNVQTKYAATIAESYKQKYSDASTGKYMPEFKEPKIEKDNVKLTFPTSEQANTFCQELAQQRRGEGFVVFDKNKKVMAYSNGDGSLYKADGQPYAAGEKLVSSKMSLEDLQRKAIEDSKLAAAAPAEPKNTSSSGGAAVTKEATTAEEKQSNIDKILQKRMAESKQSNGLTGVGTNSLNTLRSFGSGFLKPSGAPKLTSMTPDDSKKSGIGKGGGT